MQSIVTLFYSLLSQGRQTVSHLHKLGFPKQKPNKDGKEEK